MPKVSDGRKRWAKSGNKVLKRGTKGTPVVTQVKPSGPKKVEVRIAATLPEGMSPKVFMNSLRDHARMIVSSFGGGSKTIKAEFI